MLQDQENSHRVMRDNTAVIAKQERGLESTTTHRMFKRLIYNNILLLQRDTHYKKQNYAYANYLKGLRCST